MCAATAGGKFVAVDLVANLSLSGPQADAGRHRVATGSPAGLSASPVSATANGRPPDVAVSSVFGQPPAGGGNDVRGVLGVRARVASPNASLT